MPARPRLTQEALADASGLSPDTIRRLEHGSFSPSLDTLRKLCAGFDMLLSTLFESFELGERDGPRELIDALAFITPEEEQVLLQFIAVFRRRFHDDENYATAHADTQLLRWDRRLGAHDDRAVVRSRRPL